MGSCIGSHRNAAAMGPGGARQSAAAIIFQRIDKDGKGYLSLDDLKALMKDDLKAYFPAGRGAEHMMGKYGNDGKLTLEQFDLWWNSTYTTYNNEDAIGKLVDEALEDDSEHNNAGRPNDLPDDCLRKSGNVAITRS